MFARGWIFPELRKAEIEHEQGTGLLELPHGEITGFDIPNDDSFRMDEFQICKLQRIVNTSTCSPNKAYHLIS
jgi:hypothetical protein